MKRQYQKLKASISFNFLLKEFERINGLIGFKSTKFDIIIIKDVLYQNKHPV